MHFQRFQLSCNTATDHNMQYPDYTFSLLFTLIPSCILKGTYGLTIYQIPSVSVREQGTAVVNCTVSDETIGPVRWYKGEGMKQLLYSQSESDNPDLRVNKTVNKGPTRETDLSITFTHIRLEDAGVYYCVKFKSDKVTVAANGSGTHLYVNSTYGMKIYQIPSITVREGETAEMNCTVFDKTMGPIRWYKGENMKQLFYSQSEGEKSDPRVNKTVNEGPTRDTDHSITFTFIRMEDAGVYYCVKFISDKVTVASTGSGTHLYVNRTYGENIYQAPSVSGTEGGTVIMNCTLFTESLGSVKWYKGKNLQKLLYSQVESDKPDTRVTKTTQKSLNRDVDFTITFTNITIEDAGTYYCVKHKSNKDTAGLIGSGTQLYVSRHPSPPSVSGPTDRVMLHANVTLSCRAERFYPPEVNVTWWENETELLGSKSQVSSDDGNTTYQVESNITVVAKIGTSVTCKINHAPLDQPINSTFKISNIVKEPSFPSVSGTENHVDINSSVVISCISTGFYPEEINLTWWKNKEELPGFKPDIQPYGADKTYQVQSNITVRAEIDSYVTCKINHISLDQPINSTFKINDIVKRHPSPPSVSGPTDRVMLHTNVTLSCRAARFYPPEVNVTWWQNETELLGSKSQVSSDDGNTTYQVQSNITVVAKIDTSVTCKISHALLDQPINSTFKIRNIVKEPSPPSVSGPKERVDINSSVLVSCVSTGFYPKEINLTWWKHEEELHGFKPDIQPYGADKTYQVQSNITVRAEIDSYVTCKINHTALDQPINSTFKINVIVKASNTEFLSTPIIVGITCVALFGCVLLVIFLLRRKGTKGRGATQNGLATSNVDEEREQDENKEIVTYAALQLREGSSMPKKVAHKEATEYAEVHFKRAQDNNVTYADVNIAKLRTKEAIPHYYIEDHGTEYVMVKKKTKAV